MEVQQLPPPLKRKRPCRSAKQRTQEQSIRHFLHVHKKEQMHRRSEHCHTSSETPSQLDRPAPVPHPDRSAIPEKRLETKAEQPCSPVALPSPRYSHRMCILRKIQLLLHRLQIRPSRKLYRTAHSTSLRRECHLRSDTILSMSSICFLLRPPEHNFQIGRRPCPANRDFHSAQPTWSSRLRRNCWHQY